MSSYELGFAIEDFRSKMTSLGISVTAVEIAGDGSKHAVMRSLLPAMTVQEVTELGDGVIARVCGVEIKTFPARRAVASPETSNADQ